METNTTKAPGWYFVLAIIFLLWNMMGVLSFLAHTFISPEMMAELPENEQALYKEYPFWTVIAFGIATGFGFLGAVGLLLKKKWAFTVFLISFIAIVPQMIQNLFFTSSIEVFGAVQAAIMPVLVVVLGIVQLWFSRFAMKHNWLK